MSVSRALNGIPVSPENAARIKQAADALGYVPNVAAQRMRGGRTRTVGVLMNADFDPRTEVMSVLDRLIREMESADHQVLLSISRGRSAQIDTHLGGFISRGVDGLFFWNARPSKLLDRYERSGLPVVAVGYRDPACSKIPLVTLDAASVFADVYHQIVAYGHRSALELTSAGNPAMHEMFVDFGALEWRRHDIGLERDDLVGLVAGLAADPSSPTLVMADYPNAVQLLGVCEEAGLRVPEDLSVISIVDAVGAPMLRTPLSSVRTDYEALGLAAAEAMLAALDGDEVGDVYVPDSLRWVERASTGPAPTRKPARRRSPRKNAAR